MPAGRHRRPSRTAGRWPGARLAWATAPRPKSLPIDHGIDDRGVRHLVPLSATLSLLAACSGRSRRLRRLHPPLEARLRLPRSTYPHSLGRQWLSRPAGQFSTGAGQPARGWPTRLPRTAAARRAADRACRCPRARPARVPGRPVRAGVHRVGGAPRPRRTAWSSCCQQGTGGTGA